MTSSTSAGTPSADCLQLSTVASRRAKALGATLLITLLEWKFADVIACANYRLGLPCFKTGLDSILLNATCSSPQ